MTRVTSFAVLLVGSILLAWALNGANNKMREKYTNAFPQLQNTGPVSDPVAAEAILKEWNEQGANDEIRMTMLWDLLFPFFYASGLALLVLMASAPRATRWIAIMGQAGAGAALIGGIGDVAENLTMLVMLGHPDNASLVSVLRVAYSVKYAGPALALVCVVVASARSLWLIVFDRKS